MPSIAGALTGKINRISGPIVFATGLQNAALYDVVDVGEKSLIGEITSLNAEVATIQVYEDDTGLRIGEKVVSHGRPLSLSLGPGLVGTIYDGIQRPLKSIFDNAATAHFDKLTSTGSVHRNAPNPYLLPGERTEGLDTKKVWHFDAASGVDSGSAIKAGWVLGTVQETPSILHKIMVPPNVKGKALQSFKGTGDYTVQDVIGVTELGEEIRLAQYWPVRTPRPVSTRLAATEPLVTGLRVIDVFFPLSKGGTAAIPGGFGTGKTMTQHAIAKWCDADLIVYIGCGERGNEMTDVLTEFPEIIDPRTGRSIMERTILIANTSNMPVAAREVSLYSGITMAEYYRDMGMHVAIMADSTSRWAEALRELSGRMEEMPAEEGFPAYLPTRLASFYERAGRVASLCGEEGSVSVIGAVSPPGGDFSEPVTQHTKRFIRCFWALDRELANARHYPAIGWIDSYSEYADEVKDWWQKKEPLWAKVRLEALDLLKREERLQQIVRLVGPDALPDSDRLVLRVAEMIKNGFLQQDQLDEVDAYCVSSKQIAILMLIMDFYRMSLALLEGGAPLVKITSLDVLEEITRAKTKYTNAETDKLQEVRVRMENSLGELQRLYRREASK